LDETAISDRLTLTFYQVM